MQSKQIFYFLFLLNCVFGCEDSEAFYLDDNNQPQCIKCPEKCQYCSYTLDKQLYCYFCDDNYFRDDQNQCQPCANHCSSCQGTTMQKCTRIEEGYFYSSKQKKSIKCKEQGCGHCTNSQICTSCQKGYIEVKSQDKENKSEGMQKKVTCESCNIPNCTYCTRKKDQLKKEYLSCTLCEGGYFIQNEKCEKCPENCEHCSSHNGECFNCKKGFKHNKMKNTCDKNTIQYCHEMEDDEKCSSCESHFYLSEDKKECKSCSDKVEGCLYCSNTENKDFRCHSCKDGYYFDKDLKKCQQCIENCESCNKDKCYSCKHNYVYNEKQNKCDVCQIEHCITCGDEEEACYDCGKNRFFNKNTKKCEECNKNCVGCFDQPDNCQNCPVTHYTFRQEIIVEKDSGQVQNFVGPLLDLPVNNRLQKQEFHIKHKMIQVKTKCLKKCPKKFEKHFVIQDETLKECFKVYEDKNKVKNFIKKRFSGNLHEKMQQIVDNYHKQIEQDYQDTLQNQNNDKSEDCSFHGKQKYEIRGVYDNYKYCICDESHMGPICEIPRILYEQTQLNVSQILEQCSQHLKFNNKHQLQRHLHSLKRLVKIKLSLPLLEKLINIMYQISHHELNINNKVISFRIYDYIICRLIEIKELESHKNIKEKEFDSLIVREKFSWEKLLKQTMLLIEHTLLENNVKQSLQYVIKKDENIISQESYNIYEYQLKNYFPEKGFSLDNPYLNDYYSKYIGSHVYFTSKNNNLQFFSSQFIIQMIYFDAQLFDSLIEDKNKILLTNVLHMNLINPESSDTKVYPNDANIKKITIQFSLLFLPLKENFIDDVECMAFVYDQNLHSIKGVAKNLSTVEHEVQDNEEDFLVCEFDAYFPLDDHYFAILLKKN